jgi:hypothetical protein
MRRFWWSSILVAVVAATLAGPLVSEASAQVGSCEGLTVVESETLLCTHGGDPAGAVDIRSSRSIPGAPLAAAAPCPDGGTSGRRVEVIYAVPQDRVNSYAASLPSVRTAVNDVDSFLDASSPGVAGQHYRWLCENGSDVTVRNVTLIGVGADGAFTYPDMVSSLQNQVALGLGPVNYVSQDRIYLVFVDQLAGAYPFGGQGDVSNDDSPAPATNLHQVGPHYSLINGFSGAAAEHELGHNIGAVQLSAPHSSGAWHCYEENDEMCYNDGGSYFLAGGALVVNCPTQPFTQFDCNQDDYYSVQPAAGSYLASHWNVSASVFLTGLSTCDGQLASIEGTLGDDEIEGTDGPDTIVALAGNDEIRGRGGDDRICAGAGQDEVRGNQENDRLFGEQGDDELRGNPGDDHLDGGPDRDKCRGGPGTNTIVNCE